MMVKKNENQSKFLNLTDWKPMLQIVFAKERGAN